jgi:3-oxoacyl-[acyl-carrier protein] reductase
MPTALITGGEGGLARALGQALLDQGYSVHAPGRADLDVTSTVSVEKYVNALADLDLVVCTAGVCHDSPLVKMPPEKFEQVLQVNLTGAFKTARAALKKMCPQHRGHVVFVGSFSAFKGPVGQSNYAAAKAGLHGLTQSLAAEYGRRNIRVNCVLPGFMQTPMTSGLDEAQIARFREAHGLGRFNTPSEAAGFIAYLDRYLPHTSGQIFNLDSRLHREL